MSLTPAPPPPPRSQPVLQGGLGPPGSLQREWSEKAARAGAPGSPAALHQPPDRLQLPGGGGGAALGGSQADGEDALSSSNPWC